MRDRIRDRTLLAVKEQLKVENESSVDMVYSFQTSLDFICYRCGVNVENATSMTVLQTDGVEDALWYGRGISHYRGTALHVCTDRVNILQNMVTSLFRQYLNLHTFQYDNARAHIAHVSMQFLADNNVHIPPLASTVTICVSHRTYLG